jgi:uncharacterized protein YhfF
VASNSPAPTDPEALPKAEFAFPGPFRDQLVAANLDGSKTSTTGLVEEHEHRREPLPSVGYLSAVVDSDERRVAVIETISVRVAPLARVDLAHAIAEGEGFTTICEWRTAHERFWHSPEMRRAMHNPTFTVDDATLVVLERFRVIADLRDKSSP